MIERLPKPLHASVPPGACARPGSWTDADKAERLLRNLGPARPGGARRCPPASFEVFDEMLTVNEPEAPGKAAAVARLHQLDREHDGDGASRLSKCEAMAKCRHRTALVQRHGMMRKRQEGFRH